MAFDPDEIVTLGGVRMTLRRAVEKIMAIPESYRNLATIFRQGQPSILDIDVIEAIRLAPEFLGGDD